MSTADPRRVASDGAPEPPDEQPGDHSRPSPNIRRALGLSLRTVIALQIINSISGVELARGLGLHNRGALAAAMLWPSVAGTLGTIGIEESMTYHVAREPQHTARLVGSGLLLCAVQSAVFELVTLAVIPVALERRGAGVISAALIYSLYIPLNMTAVMLNAVLNGLHRYAWCNFVRLALGLAIIGSQTLLLITGAMAVHNLAITLMACYAGCALLAASLVSRTQPGRLTVDRRTVRQLFAYGIRSHASTVPSQLNQNLDQLLISIFLTTSQLGVYAVAVTMTSLSSLFGAAVAFAGLPNVASKPDGPARALLARRLVSLTLLTSAAISIPVILLAPELIHLFFGAAFVRGAGVARILLVAAIALATNRVLEGVLRGVGRPLDAGMAEILALGATAIGLAALLPTLGLTGAALSSVISYCVSMAWMTRRVRLALAISPRALLTPDRRAIAKIITSVRGR